MPTSTFTMFMNAGEKVMRRHKFAYDITMAVAQAQRPLC